MDIRRNFRCLGILGVFASTLLLINTSAVKCHNIIKTSKLLTSNINLEDSSKAVDRFLENCKTRKFFDNLRKHISYPNFGSTAEWKNVCKLLPGRPTQNLKEFFQFFDMQYFSGTPGKLTAYYQPNILVSYKKTKDYQYPILKKRKELMIERKRISESFKENDVLLWAKDDIELFFLHIQGSGLGVLENGQKIEISYDGNNGFEYQSIGQLMVKRGLIDKKKANATEIKKWLRENTEKKVKIFNSNRRFIFFKTNAINNKYPIGSFGQELIPYASVAIDKKIYPFGIPILLSVEKNKSYNLLTISADTGAAIKGVNRADLFLGNGKKVGEKAGKINESLIIYFLKPKRID